MQKLQIAKTSYKHRIDLSCMRARDSRLRRQFTSDQTDTDKPDQDELMGPRHSDRSRAVCSQDSIGMSNSFRETLRVSL